MGMDHDWLKVVKEALHELVDNLGSAPTGAQLRLAVARCARSNGLEFPPPDIGKFSSFIENFPTDFIVHRRPGSDILVAPVDRPELLSADPFELSPRTRVREDLFEALTRIPTGNKKAFYLPDTDSVVWIEPLQEVPASAVELPETSLNNEVDIRKRFATEIDLSQEGKVALTEALGSAAPLRGFSQSIHSYGLIRQWHQFRLGVMSTQLRKWSTSKAIAWQPNWLSATETKIIMASTSGTRLGTDNNRRLFALAAALNDEDLSRITVPLDVVLRLMSRD